MSVNLNVQADLPPLEQTDGGVIRIKGTRIPLERLVRAFLAGSTPEQIAHDFDVLSIKDVYAVVNYYLHHREDVDAYLDDAEQVATRIRGEVEQNHNPTGIRERLLARSSPKAD